MNIWIFKKKFIYQNLKKTRELFLMDQLKSMKNQYFLPRTLPQPPATSPELSGTATELPGAAQKLSGGGLAPAPAESGQPQNWSLARIFQNTSFKRGFSEEININNHRPKSFLSLMEDAHKVLAANRKVIFPLPPPLQSS